MQKFGSTDWTKGDENMFDALKENQYTYAKAPSVTLPENLTKDVDWLVVQPEAHGQLQPSYQYLYVRRSWMVFLLQIS